MALTQSARMPEPMWDAEVVPALRKRLQTESRTLARRISAISLSSGDEDAQNYGDRQNWNPGPSTSTQQSYNSPGRPSESSYRQPSDYGLPMGHPNGTTPPKPSQSASSSTYQRSRTYSTPDGSNFSKKQNQPNGAVRPKLILAKTDPSRPRTSTDIKPTRIPKAARPQTSGSSSPYMNGQNSHGAAVTPSHSPELPYRQPSFDYHAPITRTGSSVPPLPASSSRSTIELPATSSNKNVSAGLLNEAPPFSTHPSMSSGLSQHGRSYEQSQIADLPRPSVDSEERPYEHWYRGEVSRNGGVGELRVGRRQEMLDIANYGHLIGKKQPPVRKPTAGYNEDHSYPRKRADSIGGLTNKERIRNSVFLDDEHFNRVDHILDEHPLTDFEDQESDAHSVLTDQFDENDVVSVGAYAYVPSVDDVHSIASTAEQWTTSAGAHEARSTTPTPLGRPSSQQTQNPPPTRIPGPSSHRSSESRSTINTASMPAPPIIRGASEPAQSFRSSSSSKSSSPPPVLPPSNSVISTTSNPRSHLGQGTPSNNSAAPKATKQKRTVSPASKKAKTPVKNKPKPPQRKDDRQSVAQYPTVEGDELADAIPSWTQPKLKEGNWDEVVLPVVARNKGLNDYYEKADGSPQNRKPIEKPIEPAPGTFGFDHSKYRQHQLNDEFIPLDDFGQPPEEEEIQRPSKSEDASMTPTVIAQPEPEPDFPIRIPPSPSPAPFAHYAPTSVKTVEPISLQNPQEEDIQKMQEEEEKSGGCCKCVVM